MRFIPYVYDADDKKISVSISPMTKEDAKKTEQSPMWQTSWTSSLFKNKSIKCYSVKRESELIALGAYEIQRRSLIVYIVYMEAQPESNPTITEQNRKYHGIGSLLIAYGIKLSIDHGFDGDVMLRAKTTELENHYIKDFGAIRLPAYDSSAARFLIADEAAKRIFYRYLR